MGDKINLGIDFGTTNCAVGRMRLDGHPFVVGPIPSLGAWSNEQAVFGQQARDLLLSEEPAFPIRDLKLSLGKESFRVGHLDEDPVDLAKELLLEIQKRLAPNDTVGTAVIGTPVSVHRNHRVDLREAARRAGFEKVKFVYEPTAALIGALGGRALSPDSLALVVDWGGGTLDIAAVRINRGLFQEVGVGGDVAVLGGTRIDEEITRQLLAQSPRVSEAVNSRVGGFDLLKEQVEQAKITIIEELETEVIPIAPHWLPEPLFLHPELVHNVLLQFAVKAREYTVDALRRAHLQPEQVTHVLFAGGTSKAAAVRDEIMRDFRRAQVINSPDPQLLTGRGCTLLTTGDFHVELAADFAIRQSDDSLCVVLPRGQHMEAGRFRRADFMVTDYDAPEAIVDMGICHLEGGQIPLVADGSSFQSLRQMFIATGEAETVGGRGVPDMVRVHAGVDANLTIAVHAESLRMNGAGHAQEFLSAVPLAVRVPRGEAAGQ